MSGPLRRVRVQAGGHTLILGEGILAPASCMKVFICQMENVDKGSRIEGAVHTRAGGAICPSLNSPGSERVSGELHDFKHEFWAQISVCTCLVWPEAHHLTIHASDSAIEPTSELWLGVIVLMHIKYCKSACCADARKKT